MILKALFVQIFNKLKEFWNVKIFRYAILVQLFYFFLSILLFFLFLNQKNDFVIFYESGRIFLTDIENLYNQANYLWDFRYFPLSALFFIPFSFLDFGLAFILFNLLNFILNILISLMMYKIIKAIRGQDHETNDKRIILYISLYLMGVPHILNYIYGQINLFITFSILASLMIFLFYKKTKWQLLGSIILGISIIIKPTSFFLIPFLLVIRFDLSTKKLKIDFSTSLLRLVGVLIPVLLNFALFAAYPKLWSDFLSTNFTGSNPLALNFSISLTKLVTNFCYFFNIPFNQLIVLIVLVGLVGGLGFFSYILRRRDSNYILYGYTMGMTIMLLTYFDSWDHHLLNLTPLLIITIFNLPRRAKLLDYIKPSFFFFNFFGIIFVGVWFLTYPLFPYNFVGTFFLFVLLYSLTRYFLVKRIKTEEVELQ
jgi:hypothetical protein